jgi:hypothetical protein
MFAAAVACSWDSNTLPGRLKAKGIHICEVLRSQLNLVLRAHSQLQLGNTTTYSTYIASPPPASTDELPARTNNTICTATQNGATHGRTSVADSANHTIYAHVHVPNEHTKQVRCI